MPYARASSTAPPLPVAAVVFLKPYVGVVSLSASPRNTDGMSSSNGIVSPSVSTVAIARCPSRYVFVTAFEYQV